MTAPRRPGQPLPNSPSPRPSATQSGASVTAPGTRSLVEQIVAEQKRQKADLDNALQRKPRKSRIGPAAIVVLVVLNLVGWLVFPPGRDTTGDRRTSLEVDRDLRLVIASAASDVDIWRRLHPAQLPPSLSEAGVADSGLVLVNVDSVVYEVRGTDRGVTLVYRSNTPITDFLDAGLPVRK